jgi:hypothetical protein
MDQSRPFGEIPEEPEQSQHHEEDDEQQQAVPWPGLGLWAIDPVKFHRRVPPSFQPLHEGAHLRVPSARETAPAQGGPWGQPARRLCRHGARRRGDGGVLGPWLPEDNRASVPP